MWVGVVGGGQVGREVGKTCAFLGYQAAYSGNSYTLSNTPEDCKLSSTKRGSLKSYVGRQVGIRLGK